MVEQVRVSPEEVRGYGNICEGHTLEDFIVSDSGLAKEKENVHGALTDVYRLVYSLYGLIFSFDRGNKQLYLQTAEADTLSFGFDTVNKQLYLVDENDTGFNLGFDEDTNELYITDDAPPIVHNYTLALDSESYTTSGSLSVSATLLDDGVAVEGATVSFTGGDSAVTATTNSSGVATATVTFSASGTLTATYSNVSDTATVTVQTYLFYDACSSDNTSQYTNFYEIWGATSTVHTSLSFDTDHYVLTNSNASFSTVCLPVSAGLDNLKLTAKIRLLTNTGDKGGGVGVATKKEKGIAIFQPNGTTKHLILNNYQGTVSSNVAVSNLSTSDYNTFELIKSGQSLTFSIYDANGTQRFTKQITVSTNTDYSNCTPCISVAKSDSIYVKEIKLESL